MVTKSKTMPAGRFKARCLSVLDEVRDSRCPVLITKHGKPVARLVPPESRPRWMARDIFIARVLGHQADAGLSADLAELAPDSTADLPL